MGKKYITILLLALSTLVYTQQRWETIISKVNTDLQPFYTAKTYDDGQNIYAFIHSHKGNFFKLDKNGDILWEKVILSETNNLIVYGIKQSSNGESLLFGISSGNGSINLLNECGDLMWCIEFDSEHYSTIRITDAVFLENGNIVALAWLIDNDYASDVGLISFDSNGSLLWFNNFKLQDKYPLLSKNLVPYKMKKHGDHILISGDCYYANPDNPNGFWLRPMFIKTTNNFEEDWFLPYGVNDTIVGTAMGSISLNGDIYKAYGYTDNSLLMSFDTNGNIIESIEITNSDIGPEINDNFFNIVLQRDDTSYFAVARFGELNNYNPCGEWIMDTIGNVFQYQNHENTAFGTANLTTTSDGKFCPSYNYYDEKYNIVAYKFNHDLSQSPIDTNAYEYDYLCDDLPIASDTIYIENCSIITNIGEVPTPKEYYSSLKTIPIHIFPNPASSGITFEFGNLEQHKDILLRVIDINGQVVFEKELPNGETQIHTSVSSWQSGMYIATASSRRGGSGSGKFVVK